MRRRFETPEPTSAFRAIRERLRALSELEDWLEGPMQWLGVCWLGLVILDLVGQPNERFLVRPGQRVR